MTSWAHQLNDIANQANKIKEGEAQELFYELIPSVESHIMSAATRGLFSTSIISFDTQAVAEHREILLAMFAAWSQARGLKASYSGARDGVTTVSWNI